MTGVTVPMSPADESLHEKKDETVIPPGTTTAADVETARRGSQDPLALLEKIRTGDDAHPIRWPLWKKWIIAATYCLLQVFVTLTSTTYVSVEFLIEEKFGISSAQVATLGQSMFIIGTAVGPAFLGMYCCYATHASATTKTRILAQDKTPWLMD